MESLCILTGAKLTVIAASAFTLSWTHSVQKTEWRERWSITPNGLKITEASIKGSGAGMEPGEQAVLRDGWWVWKPELAAQQKIFLAASGMTPTGWKLCNEGNCIEFGRAAGEDTVLEACTK